MNNNTKKRSRYWAMTIWDIALNPEELGNIFYDNTNKIRYLVFQKEEADNSKTEHYQAYVELKTAQRLAAVKKLFGKTVHCEIRLGTRLQARYYCMKNYDGIYDDDYKWTEPLHRGRRWGTAYYEFGTWIKGQGSSEQLQICKDLIDEGKSMLEVADECFNSFVRHYRGLEKYSTLKLEKTTREFRKVAVEVYWGQAGSGKSRKALYEEDGSRKSDIYILEQRGNTIWFDGYVGQKTLVINDFYGWIKYGMLLNILDGHQQQLEVKGGITYANWDKVIITSNNHPREWYEKGFTEALKRRVTKIIEFCHEVLGNTGGGCDKNICPRPRTSINQQLIDELRYELDTSDEISDEFDGCCI